MFFPLFENWLFFLLYFFDLFIFFLLAQQPKEEPGNWRGKHDEEAMYLYL